jgi:O-antigen/teichoic acid export membrane protein
MYIKYYLVIVMLGSGGLNFYNWVSEGLNAIGKPKRALMLNILGSIILIPLIIIGSKVFGFRGMILGLALGQTLIGIYANTIKPY